MANQHPRAYGKNMSSLKGLELTCEKDEGRLTAKLISLQLGKDDGVDVTAAIYEEVDGGKLGRLIFEEYTTEVDAGSRKTIHETKIPKEPFVCKGRAYINNEAKNVIVFREAK